MAASDSREYFDEVAPEWADLRRSFFPDLVRTRALEVAGVEAGQVAVDVGAGAGFISRALAERGVNVIAVDASQHMLAEMAKRFTSEFGPLMEYRVGLAEDLPLSDGTADHVFANMCLHHVEVPESAVAEMARVLKGGGSLVISDLDTHDHEFLRTEQHDRWMGFERADVERWFEAAGLVDVEVADLQASCCSKSESGEEAAISIFIASGRKPG